MWVNRMWLEPVSAGTFPMPKQQEIDCNSREGVERAESVQNVSTQRVSLEYDSSSPESSPNSTSSAGYCCRVKSCFISLQSKGLSRVFSNITKSINSLALSLLYSPTLTSIHDYWKSLTISIIGLTPMSEGFTGSLPPSTAGGSSTATELAPLPDPNQA